MTRTKNSIQVAGIEVNKPTYNKIMWTILAALVAALLIGFLAFKRNLSVMSTTKKEFQELKTEFEAYRKTSREAREKLTMDHFNELKKLELNSCNLCADGCDDWIYFDNGTDSHYIRFGSNDPKLQPIKEFVDQLNTIKTQYRDHK